MTRFTKRFLPCIRYHLRTKSSFWNLKEAFGRLLSSWFVLKSGPTPTNPVDEDVISKPSVILNWSYEGIMYNQPITSERPIAPQNTKGLISISANGSYKRKIPRISMVKLRNVIVISVRYWYSLYRIVHSFYWFSNSVWTISYYEILFSVTFFNTGVSYCPSSDCTI